MVNENIITRYRSRKSLTIDGSAARWYAKSTRKNMEQYRLWAQKVSNLVQPGASVLEVAPGPGYLSTHLARLGDYRIVGLDLSATMVEIARDTAAAAGAQVDFRQGDAGRMPLAADSFDFIICTAAFKNFPDPLKVLDEMFRVLKVGGRALIEDMRRDASWREIKQGVDAMGMSLVDSLFTELAFKCMLSKMAYLPGEIRELATRSKFGGCEIRDVDMGMEITLTKR